MENRKIYEAISNVMADIGAVTKSKRSQQNYMYRGIDDVMNALNPVMAKYKVFAIPVIEEEIREERVNKNSTLLFYTRLKILYKFYADDGSFVEARVIGEAMDSGDKATNKAMSIAFKYACFQVFCIPTEEMPDPDAESHELSKKLEEEKKKAEFEKISKQKIGQIKIDLIRNELERTGVTEEAICKRYKVDKIEDITEELFAKLMGALKKTKTQEVITNE